MRVLDLGAAPGSWSLYASKQVGPGGIVQAIDINPLDIDLPKNVHGEQADIFEIDLASFETGDLFDVVLSDMAPNTTGQKHLDQYRSFELFMRALVIASRCLQEKGAFLGKLFSGGDFPEAKRELTHFFERVRVLRPLATRKESYELFLYGAGRK